MKSGRDNRLWLQSWRDQDIDFHQLSVNPLLIRFWPQLNLKYESRIFVPLCGKSLDMIWLAEQGHRVVGVELSQVAVKAFFHENKLTPKVRAQGKFTLWSHGNISILCGDYFSLSTKHIGKIDAVYDRAALTALSEAVRKRYVTKLRTVVPKRTDIFLLTTEEGKILEGVDTEIIALYAAQFDIDLMHTEQDGAEEHPAEYKVYLLTGR